MRILRSELFICIPIALSLSGCRGGIGHISMDDALDITAVEILAPGGSVRIDSVRPGLGVTGEHRLDGAGAQGRASVTLREDGVLQVGSVCLPVAPCRLDLALSIPETMPVSVDLGAGDVVTAGVANVDVLVDRGDVSVMGAYNTTVRIGEGDLQVRLAGAGKLRAVLASGDAEVAVSPGGWQVQAVAADLKMSGVSLDRLAAGSLDIHAPGGTVRVVGLEELAAR